MAADKFFKEIAGKVVTSLGLEGGVGKADHKNTPWKLQTDVFFPPINLDPERADGIYPYRLLVIDVTIGNPSIVFGTQQFGVPMSRIDVTKYTADTGGVSYKTENVTGRWEFTLPITPQQLSITDQFAINTTATMRGVVEEHNGVKFKIISASGTTGIWPNRSFTEDPNAGTGIPLFGGTAEALGQLSRAADILQNGGKSKPKVVDPTKTDPTGTGYFQALMLQQFLEQYAMAKKNPANKGWRLVFDCPKTNESFIVTPMQYNVTKSQRSPGEYLYNMQFKAWKRINLKASKNVKDTANIQKLDPNFFQKIVTSLNNARALMSAASNTIKAVRADFRKPFDELRKVTLFIKDFAGVATSLVDLPNQIKKDISSATKQRSQDIDLALGGSSTTNSGTVKATATIAAIRQNAEVNEGLSDQDIQDGVNGNDAANANQVSPINQIYEEPESNFEFFNSISLDELSLTPQQQAAIQDEIELNSLISAEEIRDIIANTQNLILDLSNNFGAGDEFFSQVYGRPAPRKRATPMSVEEFELLAALEQVVLDMNILIATRDIDDQRIQSPLEYVGGLAEDSEIPFNASSTAKYLAPVPFGLTVEEISARYLGDPDRYNEIITLNNLRSPYIDEDGFFYSLLSNGDGRQFNISSNKNLFVGQKIQLSSNTTPTFTRKITSIERITDTNYLVTVDGLSDLNSLTTVDQAKMKGFLPGTVNSQNQIFIPSDQAVEAEPRTYDIPYLKEDTLTGLSKIDWLIADNGDVVLNSFGEVALANGLNNLVQAMRMKINTAKGQILSNPEFGLGLQPGINVTDANIENILQDLTSMVTEDSRFEGVDNIELNVLPPEISLSITARLANGRGIFPINFTVPM
jgi:hypothetical protein